MSLVYNPDTGDYEDDGSEDTGDYQKYSGYYGDTGATDIAPVRYSQAADSQAANEALGITPDEMNQLIAQYPDTSTTEGGVTAASVTSALGGLPKTIFDALKSRYTKDGSVDWANVAKDALVAGATYSAYKQASSPAPKTGYQGGIPKYTAVREQLEPMATSRPGAGGQRYFSDTSYATEAGLPAAQAAIAAQAKLLNEQNTARAAKLNAATPGGGTTPNVGAPADEATINALYQQYLGRTQSPEEAAANFWGKQFGSSISPEERTTFQGAAQPELGRMGVEGLYQQYLGRRQSPEEAAADFWGKQFGSSISPEERTTFQRAAQPEIAARPATQGIPIKPLAQGGITGLKQGTYLRGSTDGMADKLDTTIDDSQAAKLSHGEFVIPADVVSHLGNGNSDAGADRLYAMMDKIRKARTGTKEQGKKINPDKFMPGGLAQAYAAGGSVQHFEAGGTPVGATGTESNLSNWAGPYVTNMLAKGEALSTQPYAAYQGPLTAGASALQTQAFGNAANLAVPTSIGEAANTAGAVGTKMGGLSYAPTAATNQFTAPAAYSGLQATNQFTAPTPYATGTFTGGTFGAEQAQQYMNPYLQASLDPQLAEARRQADITRTQQAGQMTRAGAFGGGRQAIMESEGARNLGTNLANITGQGYNTAFAQAQQQFNAEQAQQAARQQALEQSRQFGAGQAMTGAQQQAQYGQAAQAQNEQSRQFGAGQAMTGAQNLAQYGQAAQAQTEASKQFGAGFGLQALQGQLSAAQAQGQLGATQNAAGLANLQAQLAAGSQQRDIESQGIAAEQAAFNAERDNPYKMVQFQQSLLQGLPLAAQSYNITNNPYTAAASAASAVKSALG